MGKAKLEEGRQNTIQADDIRRLRKAGESILILLSGLVGLAVLAFVLFIVSFALDPFAPNVWLQFAAIASLILGGIAILALVLIRHRDVFVGQRGKTPNAID